ncbi:MAG TPA: VOC family protein [Microlunatus sp.]|nr:VOC family protein [Microlunatus sp.]
MQANRTMPDDVLVPVLAYPSVTEAVAWLTEAFGFTFRWQIEDHRAQLGVGPRAAIAITQGLPPTGGTDHVMVRVSDVDTHRTRAAAAGAEVGDAEDHFYGERQYTATDHVGRTWVFTQSVADLDPAEWGARTD